MVGSHGLDILAAAVQTIRSTRSSSAAAGTIIVFDHLITLDQEIRYIWKAPVSLGKCLFIFNRYYSLFTVIFNNYVLFTHNLSNSLCHHWFQWQGWTALLMCMTSEVVLQTRLYALYFMNKKMLMFMVSSFLFASISAAAILGNVLAKTIPTSHLLPGMAFCIPLNVPSNLYAFWIPILIFESLLCGMALYRGLETFRYRGVFQSGQNLVAILMRDSIIYFLVIFGTYLANAVIWSLGSGLIEIPAGFTVALSCVMSNRLVLNVREMTRQMKDMTACRVDGSGRHSAMASVQTHGSNYLFTDLEISQLESIHRR